VEDRWILGRLVRAQIQTRRAIDAFDFAHGALDLYAFVYSELCDWYLEVVKPRLYGHEAEVSATLLYVLRETLAMAHPFIPFVTEEVWSHLPGAEGLLAGQRLGDPDLSLHDLQAEEEMKRMIEAVQLLRGWRDRVGARPGEDVPARLQAGGYEATAVHVARLARLALREDGGDPVATVTVPGGVVEVLPGGAFDPAEAERRQAARRSEIEAQIARSEGKLANQRFVERAPAEVVQAERDKLARLRGDLEAL
jgi:valyl-tRNA synthetase